jgi:hypothetical protein
LAHPMTQLVHPMNDRLDFGRVPAADAAGARARRPVACALSVVARIDGRARAGRMTGRILAGVEISDRDGGTFSNRRAPRPARAPIGKRARISVGPTHILAHPMTQLVHRMNDRLDLAGVPAADAAGARARRPVACASSVVARIDGRARAGRMTGRIFGRCRNFG